MATGLAEMNIVLVIILDLDLRCAESKNDGKILDKHWKMNHEKFGIKPQNSHFETWRNNVQRTLKEKKNSKFEKLHSFFKMNAETSNKLKVKTQILFYCDLVFIPYLSSLICTSRLTATHFQRTLTHRKLSVPVLIEYFNQKGLVEIQVTPPSNSNQLSSWFRNPFLAASALLMVGVGKKCKCHFLCSDAIFMKMPS